MAVQLPDGAMATAVGVQIYSCLCLFCSSLMILLVWKHRERSSYIALISYATFLSIASLIGSQLFNIVRWDYIKTTQHNNLLKYGWRPELILTGGSFGPDLVFFYLEFYGFNMAAILTLFWAIILAYSIFHPSELDWHRRISRTSRILAKSTAVILPLVVVGLMQVPAIRSSIAGYLTVANLVLAPSVTLGSILLVAILAKHIQTRRKLHRWIVRLPLPRRPNEEGGEDEWDLDSRESIYDRWLTVRLAIVLLFIQAFQIWTIINQHALGSVKNNMKDLLPQEPDLSAARARHDFVQFLPASSAGLLLFLVFGTTQTCMCTMYSWFVPHIFRRETAPTITPASTATPTIRNPRTRTVSVTSSLGPSYTRSLELAL
ncbi:hypothetical protein F5B17DRAFT_407312 [Nemania serpens]|nr:hypothetical protein F5B17DRAFT_407312 [Nemania serpens]